jgi:hypothetical protein
VDYLFSFTVELFHTTKRGDAQLVNVSGQCAAAALKPPLKESEPPSLDQVRIAFDSDAVLFDDAIELPILFPPRLISPFCSFAWSPGSGPIPEGLQRPGTALHQPERAIHQAAPLIQLGDPLQIRGAQLDFRRRQVLA